MLLRIFAALVPCLMESVQVVAFDDFKRLSVGTSLAEVKVNNHVLVCLPAF